MNPSFEIYLQSASSPVDVCVTLCLLWLALSDGVLDERERSLIVKVIGGDTTTTQLQYLLKLIVEKDRQSLLLACRCLRKNCTNQGRRDLLSLLISLAVADGKLSISENHILRFFSDLFSFPPSEFKAIYKEIAGSELPEPGDPSSPEWWISREKKSESESRNQKQERRAEKFSTSIDREEAYVVLGLRSDATPEEITRAYRRLAQAHHPDRFVNLGESAQRAAGVMFQRIREAYEALK